MLAVTKRYGRANWDALNRLEKEAEAAEETEEETEDKLEGPEAFSLSYEDYLALPVTMQQAYYENFQTPEEFFEWLDMVQEEYQANMVPTETIAGDLFAEQGGIEDWE